MAAHKQRTITLPDGTVLPEPVREALQKDDAYFSPAIVEVFDPIRVIDGRGEPIFLRLWRVRRLVWDCCSADDFFLSSGLIHLTEENARAWWNYFTRLARGK